MLVAAILLTAGCGSSPVSASGGSPTISSPESGSGYLYWSDRGWIGRASLDGTGANQHFITGATAAAMLAVSSGYLYWANEGSGTIGRARLDGTGVNQKFINATRLARAAPDIYWTNENEQGNARASSPAGVTRSRAPYPAR